MSANDHGHDHMDGALHATGIASASLRQEVPPPAAAPRTTGRAVFAAWLPSLHA